MFGFRQLQQRLAPTLFWRVPFLIVFVLLTLLGRHAFRLEQKSLQLQQVSPDGRHFLVMQSGPGFGEYSYAVLSSKGELVYDVNLSSANWITEPTLTNQELLVCSEDLISHKRSVITIKISDAGTVSESIDELGFDGQRRPPVPVLFLPPAMGVSVALRNRQTKVDGFFVSF